MERDILLNYCGEKKTTLDYIVDEMDIPWIRTDIICSVRLLEPDIFEQR